MPERLRVNGVKFEQVDVPKTPVLETAPYGLALANHLVQLVRREKIDLIHLHYALSNWSSRSASAMRSRRSDSSGSTSASPG